MVFSANSKGKWLKVVIYAVNAVFMVFGILLTLWGSLNIKNTGGLETVDVATGITTLPVLAVVLGFAILVMATVGIVGTIFESYYITVVYSILLLIVTILQISLVLWMFVKRDSFINTLGDAVDKIFTKNDEINNYPFDTLEITFNCCGVDDYKDHGGTVPNTCCGILRSNVQAKCEKDVYTKRLGCGTLLKEFWQDNINLVRGVGVAISLLEIGILWIVFTLLRKFRNS